MQFPEHSGRAGRALRFRFPDSCSDNAIQVTSVRFGNCLASPRALENFGQPTGLPLTPVTR